MDSLDQIIVNWFNTGFGGASYPWAGNLVLVLVSLLAAAFFRASSASNANTTGMPPDYEPTFLVAVGSALIMIVSIYGFPTAIGGQTYNRDPARLAAQVVTGIGFLGAGTIVQTGTDVKGLTTATTIWVVMAIGLACGSGNFIVAALATALAYVCFVMMRKAEKMLARRNPIVMIVMPSDKPVLKEIILIANRYSIAIRDTQSELVSYQENSAIRITMRCSFATQSSITAFVDEIRFTLRPLELKVSTDAQ
jgi:putative Mg2+ transporter-C (MgtC) family protein